MTPFRFGLRYYRRELPAVILAHLMSFISLACDLVLPLIHELFIDYVICTNVPEKDNLFYFLLDGRAGEVHTMELFWHLAVFYLSVLAVRLVLLYAKSVINQVMGLSLETTLREAAYRKLMELDSQTIAGYNSGELLQTINSDTIMYKDMFCHIYPVILESLFVLIVSAVMLARMSVWLLLIPGALMPAFIVGLQKFKKKARENYFTIRQNNSTMNLAVQENIEAVRLVRAFTNESFEKQKFDKTNETLKQSHLKQINLSAGFDVLFSSLKQAAYIGTIAVGAILVFKGKIMVGYLVACSSYVMKIVQYLTYINTSIFNMQQMNVAGQKMMNFMAQPSKVDDVGITPSDTYRDSRAGFTWLKGKRGKKAEQFLYAKGKKPVSAGGTPDYAAPHIILNDISLKIDDTQILDHISLDIPYGKKVGIAGSTGSGKSMLLETLVRNYELSEGTISIDSHDFRSIPLSSLRKEFAYVFQEAFLFSNTITSNIQYTDDVYADIKRKNGKTPDERMTEAAAHAQAESFIKKMPLGYETIVGERGIGISGGQKQRLSIARALYRDSPVLVLDDSTSALDIETEKALLAAIEAEYPEKTLLISAHRLSSLVHCDEIIWLDGGKVVERGTFDELMALGGHFAKVWDIQEAQSKAVVDFDSQVSDDELQKFSERIGRKAD